MAATIAQKKLRFMSDHEQLCTTAYTHLLHMTLAGKKYDTSSRLNKTPPTGAPKATATPAAQAALKMPRLLPGTVVRACNVPNHKPWRTFVVFVLAEESAYDVADTRGDVHKRTLLTYKKLSATYRKTLLDSYAPRESPDATESASPTDLVNSVRPPK